MPNLLDLPREVLTRFLDNHFYLLTWSKEDDDKWRHGLKDTAALSRTCRMLHEVFNPLLYQSLAIANLSVTQRLSLMRAITSRPNLATYVEELKLDLFERRYPLRDDISEREHPDRAAAYRDAADGDWYRLLGAMILPFTNNLKHLAVRCTRYEELACNFSELNSAAIQTYCQGSGIGIDCPGAIQLLQAPKIQQLTLSGPYINNETKLEALESSTSNVSALVLHVVLISIETITTILRLPRNLDSFEFYSASMRSRSHKGGGTSTFVTFAQLNEALRPLQNSLGTAKICYPSFDDDLTHTIFGGLSFYDFSRLTKLSVAPEMYLGWKLCDHQDPRPDRDQKYPDPKSFANCLPHCLEELTIFVQQYQRPRNGDGFIHDVVLGVLRQSKRFYKLARLNLQCSSGYLPCRPCRVKAMTYLARDGTIKNSEVFQIQSMCEEAGLVFRWTDSARYEDLSQ